jgi:hypothetical protein
MTAPFNARSLVRCRVARKPHFYGMPSVLGAFTDPESLLALLRRRQDDLDLSNAALEHLCGFASGQIDKYLGPTRTKRPTLSTLAILMDGLGLSGVLVVDEAKAVRVQKRWTKRGVGGRAGSGRVSRLRRVKAETLTELARRGGNARWAGATDKERRAVGQFLAAQRRRKTYVPAHAG